jgi:NTP pyrophosphatase (non-canonical NTP hydrolase)
MKRIFERVITEIDEELHRAKTKHTRNFSSTHEGYAVLAEEVDELWDEVKKNGSQDRIREEAIQVAAMAIRIIQELTNINSFCVTPGSACSMGYCDENGCIDREKVATDDQCPAPSLCPECTPMRIAS